MGVHGPDPRNGTGFSSYTMAADMVEIIKRHSVDPRPLFLFASLIVVHYPIEAPPELVAQYEKSQPEWCKTKQTIAAMSSIADNVTAEIVGALKEQHMWNNTVRGFETNANNHTIPTISLAYACTCSLSDTTNTRDCYPIFTTRSSSSPPTTAAIPGAAQTTL